jgi:hypothetical protein
MPFINRVDAAQLFVSTDREVVTGQFLQQHGLAVSIDADEAKL